VDSVDLFFGHPEARVIDSRDREFVRWLVANRRAEEVPDFAASGRKVMG
jgi:hypothetical protein